MRDVIKWNFFYNNQLCLSKLESFIIFYYDGIFYLRELFIFSSFRKFPLRHTRRNGGILFPSQGIMEPEVIYFFHEE